MGARVSVSIPGAVAVTRGCCCLPACLGGLAGLGGSRGSARVSAVPPDHHRHLLSVHPPWNVWQRLTSVWEQETGVWDPG